MNEDFLHYVWEFQKYEARGLELADGEKLQILDPGRHNDDAGPDFLDARIYIDQTLWAGHVEIHVNSSEWYAHAHHKDPGYDNVILHVVWNYEVATFRMDDTKIPTLSLKGYINSSVIERYLELVTKSDGWIYCESFFPYLKGPALSGWLDRLYLERLQRKSEVLIHGLNETRNHWEYLLFQLLSKNFGLKVNSDSFESISRSVDYDVVKRISSEPLELEALFLGQAGILDSEMEDKFFKQMKDKYTFLKHKYDLRNDTVVKPKFFRLRPSNFPTIRLSQLAVLMHSRPHLFSEIVETEDIDDFYALFSIAASSYWDDHYSFGQRVKGRKKRLSRSFIDLLILNSVIPIKFSYFRSLGKDPSEHILALAFGIKSESNNIIRRFTEIGHTASSALEGQALLELKSNYCDLSRCTSCAIGNRLLNR